MANTTNFGWETPDDTDLVKDGAAAIRTLGSAIDTSLVDLKGGTTGQVLSKNTNTDMDFTWITQNDADAIQNTIVDAKGDLITATAADTPARLAVGSNGQILTADSTTATGLKWAAASSATNDYQLLNAGGTALTGATTITVNITAYNNLLVRVDNASASASSVYSVRFNSDTGNNYYFAGLKLENATPGKDGLYSNSLFAGSQGNVGSNDLSAILVVQGAKATGFKPYHIGSIGSGTTNSNSVVFSGFYTGTSAITSVSFISSSGNFDNGTLYIYGAD